MKIAKVKIVGNAPLLMNKRPPESQDDKAKKKDVVYDPKEDALKKAHFDEKEGFYIPSDMLEGTMREAGKNLKPAKGRGTLKKTVLANIFVNEEKVLLNRKDYDAIDTRFCTLPSTRMGIAVSRVRFDKWSAEFSITFDETRVSPNAVKSCLEEGGAVIGVGSYRPKFGRFKIEEFQVE